MAEIDGGGSSLTDLITAIQTGASNTSANLQLLIAAINNKFPNWVPVPASASAPGVAGQVAYESGHFYICVASNTWQRVAIATF